MKNTTLLILLFLFISSIFGDTIKYRDYFYEYTTLTDVEFVGVDGGYVHYNNRPKLSHWEETYCICVWVTEILDDNGNPIDYDCSVNSITDYSLINPINQKHWGGGFDVSFPNIMLGLNFYITNTEKLGYYFDFRGQLSPINEKGNYYDKSTTWSENIGDNRIGEETNYMMCNVGVIKNISPNIFLYGGGGISWEDNFYQYYDEYEILSENGKYWVNGNSLSRLNLIGGLMIILKNNKLFNQIKIGVNSTPLEIGIGLGSNLF